jgi:hypothetical protein
MHRNDGIHVQFQEAMFVNFANPTPALRCHGALDAVLTRKCVFSAYHPGKFVLSQQQRAYN